VELSRRSVGYEATFRNREVEVEGRVPADCSAK
jgi:hypothetical protein